MREASETSSIERPLGEQVEFSPHSIRRMRRLLSEQLIVELASNGSNNTSINMSRSLNLSSSEQHHNHNRNPEEELMSLDYVSSNPTSKSLNIDDSTADLNTPKLADSNHLKVIIDQILSD